MSEMNPATYKANLAITLDLFGHTNGKLDKSIKHSCTIYTKETDGVYESVHDRVKRFVEECSQGDGPSEGPAYQIVNIQPVE